MENPYLQSWGLSGLRDTRPIGWPWQREKGVRMMKSLRVRAVDKPLAQPYLCPTGSVAIAQIWQRFWPLNLGLLNSHSLGGCSPDRGGAAMRHDELIGISVDHFTAATPDCKDRN
jgi:hypothetical protein